MASRGAILRGALTIPGGARPTPGPQGSSGLALPGQSTGRFSPLAMQLGNEGLGYRALYGPYLPRPTEDFTAGAFSPFTPILPTGVDTPPPGAERPVPRRYQYEPGWNLPTGQPGQEGLKLVSFSTLQKLADVYSIARSCIEFRKNQVRGIEWDITPTAEAQKAYQSSPALQADFGKRRAKALKFFNRPDRNYFSYATWISAMIEEILVFDALSILMIPTWGKGAGQGVLGSDLENFMLINGPTIRPLLNLHGGTPRPPCYSDDTEILTRSGWKLFRDLKHDEEVATRSSNGEFEWQQPVAYVDYPYSGPMVHFYGRGTDSLVTPDHRVLTTTGPEGWVRSSTYRDDRGQLTRSHTTARREWLLPAQHLLEYEHRREARGVHAAAVGLVATSVWTGRELRDVTFTPAGQTFTWADDNQPVHVSYGPAVPVRANLVKINYTGAVHYARRCSPECGCRRHNPRHDEPISMTGDQYAAFMGMYLSEGSLSHDPVKNGYNFMICQTENGKGAAEFGRLISEIFGVKHHVTNGQLAGWAIRAKALWRYLHQFGYAKDKFAPAEILEMPKRQLEIFWRYYCLGDGAEVRYSKSRPQAQRSGAAQYAVATSSTQMADDFQEIIQKLGYSSSVRASGDGCYRMYVRTTGYPASRVREVQYSGRVYCVTVPNGVIYARRNGHPVWSGNCVAYQQYLYGVPRSDLMTMMFDDDIEESGLKGRQLAEFRGDQLLYVPMVPRTWTPYGFPPVERALIPIMTGLQKQGYQYEFFSESTVPAAYVIPGDTAMTPNQLRELQDALNAIAGDPAWKQKIIVLPPNSKIEPQRPITTADELDQLLISEVCSAFGVTPLEIGFTPGRSSSHSSGAQNQMAKQSHDRSEDTGVTPLLKFLSDIFNAVLQVICQQDDMQFTFEGLQQEEDQDALTGVLVQQMQNGLRTIDECRQELNLQPYGLEESSEPLIVTPNGPVPLSTAVQQAQNAVAQSQAQLAQTQAGTERTQAQTAQTHMGIANSVESTAQQSAQTQAQIAQTQAGTAATHAGIAQTVAQTAQTQAGTEQTQAQTEQTRAQTAGTNAQTTQTVSSTAAGVQQEQRAQEAHDQTMQERQAALAAPASASPAGAKPSRAGAPTPGHAAAVTANRERASAAKVSVPDMDKRASAEFEALARHLRKGRPVTTWTACFIPNTALGDIARSMAEGLTADEAVSVAKVRTFRLAPAEYEWVAKAEPSWPGWLRDLDLVKIYAPKIQGAFASAMTAVREFISQFFGGVIRATAQWAAQHISELIAAALRRVFGQLWTEGYALGTVSAEHVIAGIATPEIAATAEVPDWGGWEPGDFDAAALVADGPRLQQLLQQWGVNTIQSVSQTGLDDLAREIAGALAEGQSVGELARRIQDLLTVPERAEMIAQTELARAVTCGTLDRYRDDGIDTKEWLVAPDERVCKICRGNEAAGAVPVTGLFPDGREGPPGHPRCRCALVPGSAFGIDLSHITAPPLPGFNPVPMPRGSAVTAVKSQLQRHGETAYDSADRWSVSKSDFASVAAPLTADGFVAGGLAVRARDTGRVLMIQRAHNEDDPAGGYWEFPGGRPEDPGESVEEAARREWGEETGLPVPAGSVTGTWETGEGPYRGHVLSVGRESDVPILDRAKGANPDDPDNEEPEAIAWWDPRELRDNPAIRPELREHPKRVRRALETAGPVQKQLVTGLFIKCQKAELLSPGTVDYRQADRRASQRCASCVMYRPSDVDDEHGKCTLVRGHIDADHVCDRWYGRAEKKFDPAELRNARGEWTAGAVPSKRWKGQRDPVQTPTQFVNPVTGSPMGKSEIGDTFEQLFAAHGAHLLEQQLGVTYEPISATGGWMSRQTPLDFKIGDYGGELKTLNSNAQNLKTAIKREEIERKRAAVASANLRPALIVQVVDMQSQRVTVWHYPDFASKAVSKMNRLGEYGFSEADFRAAQEATGHARYESVAKSAAAAEPADAQPGELSSGDVIIELRDGEPWLVPVSSAAVEKRFDSLEPRDAHGEWSRVTGTVNASEITSAAEARAFGRKLSRAFTYTPAQVGAITGYIGNGYQDINDGLRSGNIDAHSREMSEHLSSAMQPLPAAVIVHRELDDEQALRDLSPGDVIADHGFSSTSLTSGAYDVGRENKTVLHITVPKGTPAVWAQPFSDSPEERELILDRDQPLHLTAVHRDSQRGVTIAYMTAMPKSAVMT
jgi:SPP1 gp7 family putative phage head morphogenesis protein